MPGTLREVFGDVYWDQITLCGPCGNPLYIRKICLKVEVTAFLIRVKEILRKVYENMLTDGRFKSLILYYDVDPM